MHRLWKNIILVLTASFIAGACGEGRERGRGADDGGSDGGGKKQVITQKGSDSMILLAQKWAEEYAKKNPNVQVQVTGGGSGTGISSLINGTTDIANASRPMKDDEKQQIKQKYGSDVVEIPVAKDGITVYTHAANPVDQLTMEQLRDIYAGKVTNWKQVGGPDRNIILYGRENSSGTYEYFKEHVLNKGDFAPSTQTLSGTAAVVSAVSKDETGIGYGGEAFGTANVKRVKLVGADGAAVESTEANVLAGTYPLSRSLYFYLREQPQGATKEFVEWVQSPEGQAFAKEAGYFPLK
jgi:phosphate transport system substrate-binding protein